MGDQCPMCWERAVVGKVWEFSTGKYVNQCKCGVIYDGVKVIQWPLALIMPKGFLAVEPGEKVEPL